MEAYLEHMVYHYGNDSSSVGSRLTVNPATLESTTVSWEKLTLAKHSVQFNFTPVR